MRGIVGISSVPWDYLPIAPQQTLKNLAKEQPVLFVERQRSIAGAVIEPGKAWQDTMRIVAGLREGAPNLHVLTPPFAAPWTASSMLANRLSMSSLRLSAQRAAKSLGFEKPVVIAYVPQAHLLREAFSESCFVYDVIDEYSAFPNMNLAMCKELEEKMCQKADLVFAISENLVEDRKKLHDRVFHLPIGAETERFQQMERGASLPAELAGKPRPIVGYYGSIDDRMDMEFCLAAATKLVDVTFLFFGPVRANANIGELKALQNVFFPGPIDYEKLPHYSVNFDVCVLPYAKTRFNQFIFPNKIFEYLATGNPVVTSDVPSIRYLARQGLLTIAKSAKDYVAAVKKAIASKDVGQEDRRNCALENTWQNRAKNMWQEIVQFLSEKGEEVE